MEGNRVPEVALPRAYRLPGQGPQAHWNPDAGEEAVLDLLFPHIFPVYHGILFQKSMVVGTIPVFQTLVFCPYGGTSLRVSISSVHADT